VVRTLATELLKKRIDRSADPDRMDHCDVCRTLLDRAFAGDDGGLGVRIHLDVPVIGIGAPVHYFLPKAARLLGAETVIPPHADVANAVGAITSNVSISRQVTIRPNEAGRFTIDGLPGNPQFRKLDEAEAHAVAELRRIVEQAGVAAGAGGAELEIVSDDKMGEAADGMEIFLSRTVTARLTGRPDVKSLAARE